jgi:aryl-alcohol dehydrogenase-like predicted oxidoreductase
VLGARTLKQLEDCLGAADIGMTPELRDSISALSATPPPATDRNEEAGPHRHAVR